jgi:hypothetical protein
LRGIDRDALHKATTTPPCTTRQLQPSPLDPSNLPLFTFHFSPSHQSLSLNSAAPLMASAARQTVLRGYLR